MSPKRRTRTSVTCWKDFCMFWWAFFPFLLPLLLSLRHAIKLEREKEFGCCLYFCANSNNNNWCDWCKERKRGNRNRDDIEAAAAACACQHYYCTAAVHYCNANTHTQAQAHTTEAAASTALTPKATPNCTEPLS